MGSNPTLSFFKLLKVTLKKQIFLIQLLYITIVYASKTNQKKVALLKSKIEKLEITHQEVVRSVQLFIQTTVTFGPSASSQACLTFSLQRREDAALKLKKYKEEMLELQKQ